MMREDRRWLHQEVRVRLYFNQNIKRHFVLREPTKTKRIQVLVQADSSIKPLIPSESSVHAVFER